VTALRGDGGVPANRDLAARDCAAFRLAREYLLSFGDLGVTDAVIDYYVEPPPERLRPATLGGVYLRVLASAQNANMRANVVGGAIGGVERLDGVLCAFAPRDIVARYGDHWEALLDVVEGSGLLAAPVRREPRSIWPLFCRSALSGALFLSEFEDADDFYRWVEVFDGDDRIRPALPMLLSYEIDGFGFPLACDFLKEIGFLDFGKPDVHLKAILGGLGLTRPSPGDYEAFKAITRIASAAGASPYHVDKLFWLVGSGYFYDHADVGRSGRVPTDRAEFIAATAGRLAEEYPGDAGDVDGTTPPLP
jgi:hypothetical protein